MAKRPNAAPEAAKPNTVTNDKPGFTLHLGDGRKLKFGESAEVSRG